MAFDIAQNGFNRNILYCKALTGKIRSNATTDLIETFCIVNQNYQIYTNALTKYLIETFCIVNKKSVIY